MILKRSDLRKAMYVIPNLFTVSSIICGAYAIYLCIQPDNDPRKFFVAALAILFGFFFDCLDGRVARLTKTQSDFGTEIDSLADLVTFGVAPAMLIYSWALPSLEIYGFIPCATYIVAGAVRLARFNVISHRSKKTSAFFLGLPIPLAALMLISLIIAHQNIGGGQVTHYQSIVILMFVLSYLMVSNVRFHSFKTFKVSAKTAPVVLVIVGVMVYSFTHFHPGMVLLSLGAVYILLGLLEEVVFFKTRNTKIVSHDSEDEVSELGAEITSDENEELEYNS